eukprot:scaffold192528_cov17-Prasinocladus_malaysianus.AAC.1
MICRGSLRDACLGNKSGMRMAAIDEVTRRSIRHQHAGVSVDCPPLTRTRAHKVSLVVCQDIATRWQK